MRDDLPSILGPGYLEAFNVDVPSQQVNVELSHAYVDGLGGPQALRAVFNNVMHLKFTGDLPVVFGENEVHTFEEKTPSDLLRSIEDRRGYAFFVTDVYTVRLSWLNKPAPVLRHYFLHSSFMGAEWLCTSVTYSVEPMTGTDRADATSSN